LGHGYDINVLYVIGIALLTRRHYRKIVFPD